MIKRIEKKESVEFAGLVLNWRREIGREHTFLLEIKTSFSPSAFRKAGCVD